MWKKLAAGAAIIAVLVVLVMVGYVRAVPGSYQIIMTRQGELVGSGTFEVKLEAMGLTASYPFHYFNYSVTGTLKVGKPIKDLAFQHKQEIVGDYAGIRDFYIAPEGAFYLMLDNSYADAYFMIEIPGLRGRALTGRFGWSGFGGGLDEFAQCTVTKQ